MKSALEHKSASRYPIGPGKKEVQGEVERVRHDIRGRPKKRNPLAVANEIVARD